MLYPNPAIDNLAEDYHRDESKDNVFGQGKIGSIPGKYYQGKGGNHEN